jgi:hypothetical protein
MRMRREPAKTMTVVEVVTMRAVVDKLLFWKYFETSYQLPGSLFFEIYIA